MLVLSRKLDEQIEITMADGRIVTVIMLGTKADGTARLGIEAPQDVVIHRQEVADEIRRERESRGRTQPAPESGDNGGRLQARIRAAQERRRSSGGGDTIGEGSGSEMAG